MKRGEVWGRNRNLIINLLSNKTEKDNLIIKIRKIKERPAGSIKNKGAYFNELIRRMGEE